MQQTEWASNDTFSSLVISIIGLSLFFYLVNYFYQNIKKRDTVIANYKQDINFLGTKTARASPVIDCKYWKDILVTWWIASRNSTLVIQCIHLWPGNYLGKKKVGASMNRVTFWDY